MSFSRTLEAWVSDYQNPVPADLSAPAGIGWCAGNRRAIDLIARSGCRYRELHADIFGTVADTSCILAWLIEEGYEVYAFMADVGQEEVWSGCLRGTQAADMVS